MAFGHKRWTQTFKYELGLWFSLKRQGTRQLMLGREWSLGIAQQDQDKAPLCASQELPVWLCLVISFLDSCCPSKLFLSFRFQPLIYFPSATAVEHTSHCLTSPRCPRFLNRCPNYQGWWAVTASLFPMEFWAPLRALAHTLSSKPPSTVFLCLECPCTWLFL